MKTETKKILDENFDSIKTEKQENCTYYELYKSTPAGEDWSIHLTVNKEEDFEKELLNYCRNYDKDEEFKIWSTNAGKNKTPDIDTLYEDAKWKESFLEDIEQLIICGKSKKTKINEARFFNKEQREQIHGIYKKANIIAEKMQNVEISKFEILHTELGDIVSIEITHNNNTQSKKIEYNPYIETWDNFLTKIESRFFNELTFDE